MPKQLYIPLPCGEARESMLRRQLGPGCGVRADLPDAGLAKIVARTAGYSGSDMRNLIQEASQVTGFYCMPHYFEWCSQPYQSQSEEMLTSSLKVWCISQTKFERTATPAMPDLQS